MIAGGTNGQWVRARNEEGMNAFMAERDADQQKIREHARRRDEMLRAIMQWIRNLFRGASARGKNVQRKERS